MAIEEIKTVCFVGAGTMGCYNALLTAISGYDVVIYDVVADNLELVSEKQQEMAAFLVNNGYCRPEAIPEALKRISLTPDLEKATANADLVSESVFERLDLKRQVHQQLDDLCPPGTILTTNTSSLLVSDIEDAVQRGERFAALHFYLGALLVDIVGGARTNPDTIDTLRRYVLSLNGTPLILKKEHQGYVLNAMIGPLLTISMILVIDGFATQEEVDRAWMRYRRAPMGPFGMMDLFGINVVLDSWQQQISDASLNELKSKIIPFLTPYQEKGELGMKTEKGFYTYPEPVYQQSAFLEDPKDISGLYNALISMVLQNAVLIAQRSVAEPQDIDRAWMAATYLDMGPFGILDQMGLDTFLATLEGQVALQLLSPKDAKRIEAYLQPHIDRNALGEKSGRGFYAYPNPLYKKADFLQGMQ